MQNAAENAAETAAENTDANSDGEAFITPRAHHAMQRLAPRGPAAIRWLALLVWRLCSLAWSALVSIVVGVLADSIGSSQRVNLLAALLWALLLRR